MELSVLIADDHPLFREALKQVVLDVFEPGTRLIECTNFEEARAAIGDEDLEVALLDLNMPGMSGFASLMEMREADPATPIVIVSASEERDVIDRAFVVGAAGYIPKSLAKEEMVSAINTVMGGDIYRPNTGDGHAEKTKASLTPDMMDRVNTLTRRQRNVLSLIARGKPNKLIAYELDVTNTTVKAHVTAILRKLKVTSRTQAAILAREIERVK
jgi:DNA-binding NarL/FixJ family response regulator